MENGGAYGATMAKQESAVLLLGTFMLVLPKHGEINIIFLGSIIANSSFDLWSSCDPKSHRLQSWVQYLTAHNSLKLVYAFWEEVGYNGPRKDEIFSEVETENEIFSFGYNRCCLWLRI